MILQKWVHDPFTLGGFPDLQRRPSFADAEKPRAAAFGAAAWSRRRSGGRNWRAPTSPWKRCRSSAPSAESGGGEVTGVAQNEERGGRGGG